jgi:hypothetical protein
MRWRTSATASAPNADQRTCVEAQHRYTLRVGVAEWAVGRHAHIGVEFLGVDGDDGEVDEEGEEERHGRFDASVPAWFAWWSAGWVGAVVDLELGVVGDMCWVCYDGLDAH